MSRINEILLVSHTHHDVGYTHTPDATRSLHWRAIAAALRLCEQDPKDDRARLRWTVEVSRPLLEFLEHGSSEDVQRLHRLAGGGLVAATGGYLNMTQLVGTDELERSYAPVERLRRHGLDVRVVQHGDVNGLPWGTVPAMRRAGLSALVMALNPNHGRAPFEQPSAFWWEGPDGSRVLTWLSLHYGVGQDWGVLDGDMSRAEPYLSKLVSRLDEREDYPFDFAVVHLAHDNRFPSLGFQPLLRQWNADHPDQPMRTVTINDVIDRALATGADLPVHRGEWADWWAHGHGSSAREVGIARRARSLVSAAQSARALALLAEAGPPRLGDVVRWDGPPAYMREPVAFVRDSEQVYDDLLLFEEHTWGSWNSVTDPHGLFTRVHWHAKATFAYRALDRAWQLYAEGLHALTAAAPTVEPDVDDVLVYNASGHRHSEAVALDGGDSDRVVVARDLPPTGLAVYRLRPVASPAPGQRIQTDRYMVEVDPARGGVISLIDLQTGREWVDRAAGHGLGAVIYEHVPHDCDHPMIAARAAGERGIVWPSREYFHPDTPGPEFLHTTAAGQETAMVTDGGDWIAISWHTSGPTMPSIHTSLRLYHDLDVIDLTVRLTKEPCLEAEGVHVAFPFAVDRPRFLLETAGAVFEADKEQLPGTCRDWYSVQHAAAAVEPSGAGVLWGTREAPLVQLGGLQTGRWAKKLDADHGHIYAWLMNNLYFTNFRAAQAGVDEFSFRFLPCASGVDAAAVHDFGARLANAPVARKGLPQPQAPLALLDVQPATAVLRGLNIADDGVSVEARIQSLTNEPLVAEVRWLAPNALTAQAMDGETPTMIGGTGRALHISMRPQETKTVLLHPSRLEGESHG